MHGLINPRQSKGCIRAGVSTHLSEWRVRAGGSVRASVCASVCCDRHRPGPSCPRTQAGRAPSSRQRRRCADLVGAQSQRAPARGHTRSVRARARA
eukprot:6180357-Pleurochrysis_carterae.AAC.4